MMPSASACNPLRRHMLDVQGKARAYICQDFSCKAPTSDPAVVRQTLASSFTPRSKTALTQPVDLSQLGKR